jgi:hypothetical protein
MKATPSDVVYLVEGVIPSSLVSSLGESLDHVGRTTAAPVGLLPPLRRHLGSSAGGGHLLFSERFSFCTYLCYIVCIVRIALVVSRRMLCRRSALTDASPPFCSGGCFVAIVVLVEDRFWRMLCRRGRLLRWMLCHLCCVVDLAPLVL